jgi:hypothetical protein
MKRLRELFDLFEQRTALMQLLDLSQRADGVQIFIGGESGLAPLDECSVVTAPYEVDGRSSARSASSAHPHGLRARHPDRRHHRQTAFVRADLPGQLLMPRYLPEPAYRHGSPALTAVLLINLGTPAAPTAQAVRSYLASSSPTRASSRFPRAALVADPERHHPQQSAATVGRKVRVGLDCRRLAAEGSCRTAGQAAARFPRSGRASGARRLRDALRSAVDCRDALAPQGRGLHTHSAAAPLPAICRQHDGHRPRCGRRLAEEASATSRKYAASGVLPIIPGYIASAGSQCSRALDEPWATGRVRIVW